MRNLTRSKHSPFGEPSAIQLGSAPEARQKLAQHVSAGKNPRLGAVPMHCFTRSKYPAFSNGAITEKRKRKTELHSLQSSQT